MQARLSGCQSQLATAMKQIREMELELETHLLANAGLAGEAIQLKAKIVDLERDLAANMVSINEAGKFNSGLLAALVEAEWLLSMAQGVGEYGYSQEWRDRYEKWKQKGA